MYCILEKNSFSAVIVMNIFKVMYYFQFILQFENHLFNNQEHDLDFFISCKMSIITKNKQQQQFILLLLVHIDFDQGFPFTNLSTLAFCNLISFKTMLATRNWYILHNLCTQIIQQNRQFPSQDLTNNDMMRFPYQLKLDHQWSRK